MTLRQKFQRLKNIIHRSESCVVAFSGGVDSTLLLKAVSLVLPKGSVIAVTAYSATYPREELLFAKKIAGQMGLRHQVINTGELEDKRFLANTAQRCYFCKKELFARLKRIAAESGLRFVFDASTLSDKSDFRPGESARRELKVRSPLVEAHFSKQDVRALSRSLGLSTWDKPSLACLASRIPYGVGITRGLLERVDRGERYLRKMGFRQVRLRHYNGLCRIEVPKADIPRLMGMREQLIDKFKGLGYNYVTVDLEGFRTGSMNEVLRRKKR